MKASKESVLIEKFIRPMVRRILLEATTEDLVLIDSTWKFPDRLDVKKLMSKGIKVYVNPENADMGRKRSDEVYMKFSKIDMETVATIFDSNPDELSVVADYLRIWWD